jgi:hypothetical protein
MLKYPDKAVPERAGKVTVNQESPFPSSSIVDGADEGIQVT